MLSRLRSYRPNHTTVVAYLALFVALGGSSYAAIRVTGRNVQNRSLTGKDIRKNSLTTIEVKNHSLRPSDLNASALVKRADLIGTIHGDAGAVAAHSCTTSEADAGGARVGDLPVMAFVGNNPAPPGLVFEPLKITSANHMTLRFCNPTNFPSPGFAGVGVRIITFR